MPVGFNSPARNLFLLGSTGAQVVTNFFRRIDQSAGTDGVYLPDEIRYNVPDQKFFLAGSNETASSKGKGWFEKRTEAGTLDWSVEIQSTQTSVNTTLKALELDGSNNLIVAGKTGTVPWIAKYTNGGVITWQVTSNTTGLGYTGIAVDSSNNIYACGSTSTQAYIERVDGTGSYSWGKYSSTTAGAITFAKCDANSRGEVVAVGKIEDTIKDKGYIAKVNTTTGELLWDRTLEDHRLATSSSYWQTECTDVYIDSKDQIYVVGTIRDTVGNKSKGFLIKYSAEGNIVWQKETKLDRNFEFYGVKSDGETQQTIVAGRFTYNNDNFVLLNKYSQDGTLLWSRTLYSSLDQTIANVSLDADPSFFYLLFTDETTNLVTGEPDTYTFGKVSTSGNGFGAFQYSSGGINYDYTILNITDNIGKLSDGSVRQDNSDLITYPFGANKILFDDLATQVANKKVQVAEAGTYSDPTYSIVTAGPSITPLPVVTSGLVLYLDAGRKDSYSGSGTTWSDLSGNASNGTLQNDPIYSSTNGGSIVLDGTNDRVLVSCAANTVRTFNSTTQFVIKLPTYAGGQKNILSYRTSSAGALYIGKSGGGIFCYYDQLSTPGFTAGNIFPNTIAIIHVTCDANTNSLNVYVNGVQVGSGNRGGWVSSYHSTLYLGYDPGTGEYMEGNFYNFAHYNRVLSLEEINRNYNALRGRYGV